MARRPTAAQLREKRSRMLAIGCSVLLLIVMVVQGPKLLKALHGGSAPAGGTVAGALPAGVNPSLSKPTATGSAAVAVVVNDGHLGDLSRFALKDPFVALVKVAAPAASSSTAAAGKGASTAGSNPTPAKTPKLSPAAAAAAAVAATVTFTATKTPPNAAVLKLNGKRQLIFVGSDFPTANPLFTLVALDKKDIRIGVLGGSFTSGAPTIKLRKGKRLTLANRADGSRYVLMLMKFTTATPPPAAPADGSSTTTGTTTTGATTTTPGDTTTTSTTPSTITTTPAG